MKIRLITILFFLAISNTNASNKIYTDIILSQSNSVKSNTLLSKVLMQLNLSEMDIQMELYVEKILPYDKKLSVMVIPKISEKKIFDSNNATYEFDAYILLVDNNTGIIQNKFFERKAWESDAVELSSIEIDTAPYILSNNVRGFGIKVNYEGSSHPNPYTQTDFSLFVKSGGSLKRVLKNYPVSEFHGEWDTNCVGDFETKESTIVIEKVKSNGLNNISIKQNIAETKNYKIGSECKEKIKKKKKTITLRFNKVEYT